MPDIELEPFCPLVNDIMVLKSNFVMYWGVEPAILTATIPCEEPPTGTIVYTGKNISLEMHVINWTKNFDGVYTIQAADEPYFWKNKRIAVKFDDPIYGVEVENLVQAIQNATGWNVNISASERVPYILFSGSVIEAIELVERMTGLFATLDHKNKEINFVSQIPINPSSGGFLLEEGYSKEEVDDVVCYGTLFCLPKDNKEAIYDTGISEYGYLEASPPAESWEITMAAPLSTKETYGSTFTSIESVTSNYAGGQSTRTYETTRQEVYKNIEVLFVATTLGLKQDEVMLRPVGSVSVGGQTLSAGSLKGRVRYAPPYGAMSINPYFGNPGSYNGDISERAKFISDVSAAQAEIDAIIADLTAGRKNGIYIIVTPNYEGDNDASSVSADYFFGFRVFVAGKVLVPYYKYTLTTVTVKENGVLIDTSTFGKHEDPAVPNLNMAFVSLFLRTNLLRHLIFEIELDGYRIKFPYAASASGEVMKTTELSRSDVMYIQLNEAASIEAAISYARLSKDLINKNGYVAVLDGDPENASKYIEDFADGMFRAISYYRR